MEQDSSLRLAALPSPCRLSTVANNMQSLAFMSWRRLFPFSCRTGCSKRSCIVCYYCQLLSTPSQQMTKKRDSTQQVSQGKGYLTYEIRWNLVSPAMFIMLIVCFE